VHHPLFDTPMPSPPARRPYVRKKRQFNACAAMISKALRVMMAVRNEPFTYELINDLAPPHAQQVEAAC